MLISLVVILSIDSCISCVKRERPSQFVVDRPWSLFEIRYFSSRCEGSTKPSFEKKISYFKPEVPFKICIKQGICDRGRISNNDKCFCSFSYRYGSVWLYIIVDVNYQHHTWAKYGNQQSAKVAVMMAKVITHFRSLIFLCCILERTLHSRPQSPRSFWPKAGIESSGQNRFSEHAQSICFIFSANQICQMWREVRESRTSGLGQSQSSRPLPQVRRIVALETRMHTLLLITLNMTANE